MLTRIILWTAPFLLLACSSGGGASGTDGNASPSTTTQSNIVTVTATETATATVTQTGTNTASTTATNSGSGTATQTSTGTSSSSSTATNSGSATQTSTSTGTSTSSGTSSAVSVATLPKVDIVVFQDDSSSMTNAMTAIKSQLNGFAGNSASAWNFRFVVLPLLRQQSLAGKFVLANECDTLTGASQCSPDVSAFNAAGNDSAWIATSGTASPSTDLGFANMKDNIDALSGAGYFRTGAQKIFFVISNGEDNTSVAYATRPDGAVTGIDYSSATTQASFNNYQSYFAGLSINKFYSIVAAQRYSDCWGGGSTWQGKRYQDLASSLGGTSYDLCDANIASALTTIAGELATYAATLPIFGAGQCAAVTANTDQYFVFYGDITPNYPGIQGALGIYGYGSTSFGGSNYYRNLNTGDSTNVYVSGGNAYAVLHITASTANAIISAQSNGYYGYGNNAQICGLYIDQAIIPGGTSGAGYSGTLGGGVTYLWGSTSWITNSNGLPMQF